MKAGLSYRVLGSVMTSPSITSVKGLILMPPKKPVWDKKRPEGLGESKKLSSEKKASAKAMAKAAGRPYPNLVDNMRAAKK